MKNYITILAAAILLVSITACSGKTDKTPDSTQSTSSADESNDQTSETVFHTSQKAPDPERIEAAIAEALGGGYYCTQPASGEEISLFFKDLDLSKIESYIVKQTAEPDAKQDTIAIFKCESGYADTVAEILNRYYEQVIINTRDHPFEVLKVNGIRIYKIEDTVMFIFAGASPEGSVSLDEEAELADTEYAKIDRAIKKLFGAIPENLAKIPLDPSWLRV